MDVDASTLDNGKSHKEGVERTYLETDGFALSSATSAPRATCSAANSDPVPAQPEGYARVSRAESRDDQGTGIAASHSVPARQRE